MQPGVDFFIERLDTTHRLNKFSVGSDEAIRPLKSFLLQQALNYQDANVAVTYVAALPPDGEPARSVVIGYITLTCSEVNLANTYALQDCEHANRYQTLPALKIGRLATHTAFIGQGIGKSLMDFAVALAVDHVGASVGCRFLVTDSKQQSLTFYQSQGFTLLDTPENIARPEPVMFLDLNKLTLVTDTAVASDQVIDWINGELVEPDLARALLVDVTPEAPQALGDSGDPLTDEPVPAA